MKVIVGLGNPGKDYKNTRHNVGYMVLEELAARFQIEKQESKFDAIIGHIRIKGEKVLLVKPLTFMNLSGKSVQPLVNWYKLNLDDLIVVYDDMDLPIGTIRIRNGGGNGGHNGMKSIAAHLNTQEFARVRIGIDRPEKQDAVTWVLGRFNEEDQEQIGRTIKITADALEKWATVGIVEVMNTYNNAKP
ncbi:MAG: aminoacyl-tRNA hydrolase [Syntrophomonas sp.]|nr:aminoacyl-tRNA hydrolase [Syntrophomonas sp.]